MKARQMLQNSNMCKGNFLKADEGFYFIRLEQISQGLSLLR
jgi:hypothetical protein